MAKYLDKDGLLYFWQQLKTKLAGKVDVESGKGLSTNDFTTAEKTKLEGIATGAEVNVLEGVTVNGTAAPIANKIAAITTPQRTSDLVNDGDGTSEFATEEYVDQNGGKIDSISINNVPQTIDQNKNVDLQIPPGASPSSTVPKMDGTAAVGTETTFARGDHVHPSDTSKQDVLTFDTTPTAGSTNPVTSGGILTALGDYLTTQDAASTYATKQEVGSAMVYKGSVASVADLPTTGNKNGDVYDVLADGSNYAWDGTKWDKLSETFSIDSITNAEIDTIMAS